MNLESPMKRVATEFSTKISVLLWVKVCQHVAQNSGMYLLMWLNFSILARNIFLNLKIAALLIETMMLGAKIVLKDFQELGGIGKKYAFEDKLK